MTKFWKKTFPFLLLNILVSVAAMLAVLWFWQQRTPTPKPQSSNPVIQTPQPRPTTEKDATETTDTDPQPAGVLSIEGVFGAGDLNVEYILIRNQSDTSVNLNNWSVASDNGESFILPSLILNKNGAVRLYSKHGTNSVIELHWNSDLALWASGDEIYLIDGSGQQQASWQVP